MRVSLDSGTLYSCNLDATGISAYALDMATGIPSPLNPRDYSYAPGVFGVAISPDGRFFYAAHRDQQLLTLYSRNG